MVFAISLGEALILALGLYVGINIGVKIVITKLQLDEKNKEK